MREREACRNLILGRFHYIIALTAPRVSPELRQEIAQWFANTMMFIIDLFVAEWKMPTPEDLIDAGRQAIADAILREALGGEEE